MGTSQSKASNIGASMLAPDTIYIQGDGRSASKPCIITKETSPFVQFCLLAEALINTRDRIVRQFNVGSSVFRDDGDGGSYRPAGVSSQDSDSSDDSSDDGTMPGYNFGFMGPSPHANTPQDPEVGFGNGGFDDIGAGVEHGGNAVQTSHVPSGEDAVAVVGDGIRNAAVGGSGGGMDVRHRTAQSPTRETWTVDLGTAATPSQPLMTGHQQQKRKSEANSSAKRHRHESSSPFGDLMTSAVVQMIPYLNGEEGGYCRIERVELWAAYRVYVTVHSEDAGLIHAVQMGAIDLSVPEYPSVNASSPGETISAKVNAWREEYAEDLNERNTAMDTFLALSKVYFSQAAANGDTQAAGLAKLVDEINESTRSLLPRLGPATEDAGTQ